MTHKNNSKKCLKYSKITEKSPKHQKVKENQTKIAQNGVEIDIGWPTLFKQPKKKKKKRISTPEKKKLKRLQN